MKRFIVKILLVSLPLFGLLLFIYIFINPFKVIGYSNQFYPSVVGLNRDFVSTQTFIENNKQNNYDSFILGNSRSIFYQINTWKRYIGSFNCFHFDASGESLSGVYLKLRYLELAGSKIKNVLIVLDGSLLEQTSKKEGHSFLSHPALGENNWISFQYAYLKTFYSYDFLIAYSDYLITGQIKQYMKDAFLLTDVFPEYTMRYNEIKYTSIENSIKSNSKSYYEQKKVIFYQRDSVPVKSPQVVFHEQITILSKMKQIFDRHHTRYRIVISPLYNQNQFNRNDLIVLDKIFGSNNVFDFSGKNQYTNNITNYYETSHYRPIVANAIMKVIYKKQK
ncbi:MAG: hypothetical protein QM800_14630 [Paludibacter sp.]